MTVHMPPPYTPPPYTPPPPQRPRQARRGGWLGRTKRGESRAVLLIGALIIGGFIALIIASEFAASARPDARTSAPTSVPAARWGSVCTITDTQTGVVEVYARTVMLSGEACVDGHGNPLPDLGAAFSVVDTTAVDGNAPAYPDGAVCSYSYSPSTKTYQRTPTTGVPDDATALTTISAPSSSYDSALTACATVAGGGVSTTN